MTQTQQIERHLSKHGSITTWTAFAKYGITRLAARIWDLKQDGWNIKSEEEKKNKKHYTRYRI